MKIVQLLVIQGSLWQYEAGESQHPGSYLRTFRGKWLMRDGSTPFAWILLLRQYGRRIRNTTTSVGLISWADDRASLAFKDLRLNLNAFRGFLRSQMMLLGTDLWGPSLLEPEEQNQLPTFGLSQLTDNPACRQPSWSFIRANGLQKYNQWLLKRVLQQDALRKRFLGAEVRRGIRRDPQLEPQWQVTAVRQYLKQERRFLARFAMLVQVLSGQPARGSELFSLRFQNTITGGPRNVYLEHGLVTFITMYHKGYNIKGSLKLINRFLPPELSQRYIQYIVFIRPFIQQLHRLVLGQADTTAFIWDPANWRTSHLSDFWAEESARELGDQSRIQVSSWRHLAIAISREFMPKGEYFDREVNADLARDLDSQAAHDVCTAAMTYGRLVSEAEGQIRPARERYRRISLLWQDFWLPPKPTSPRSSPHSVRPQPNPRISCSRSEDGSIGVSENSPGALKSPFGISARSLSSSPPLQSQARLSSPSDFPLRGSDESTLLPDTSLGAPEAFPKTAAVMTAAVVPAQSRSTSQRPLPNSSRENLCRSSTGGTHLRKAIPVTSSLSQGDTSPGIPHTPPAPLPRSQRHPASCSTPSAAPTPSIAPSPDFDYSTFVPPSSSQASGTSKHFHRPQTRFAQYLRRPKAPITTSLPPQANAKRPRSKSLENPESSPSTAPRIAPQRRRVGGPSDRWEGSRATHPTILHNPRPLASGQIEPERPSRAISPPNHRSLAGLSRAEYHMFQDFQAFQTDFQTYRAYLRFQEIAAEHHPNIRDPNRVYP